MTFVLLIKKDNPSRATLKDIEAHLKTDFKSVDHMQGFCEGYLFDSFKIHTLAHFEECTNGANKAKNPTEDYYIKFVHVSNEG